VRAAVVEAREQHRDWSLRRIAAETGASKDTVARVLKAAGASAALSLRSDQGPPGVGASPTASAPAGSLTPAQALWKAREMSEADHAAFDADPPMIRYGSWRRIT
jgi:hypothetical protein